LLIPANWLASAITQAGACFRKPTSTPFANTAPLVPETIMTKSVRSGKEASKILRAAARAEKLRERFAASPPAPARVCRPEHPRSFYLARSPRDFWPRDYTPPVVLRKSA